MLEDTRVEQAQLVGPHSRFGWAKLNGVLGEILYDREPWFAKDLEL